MILIKKCALSQNLIDMASGGLFGISGGRSILPVAELIGANEKKFQKSKFIIIDERDVPIDHYHSNYQQIRKKITDDIYLISAKTVFKENWKSANFDCIVMGFGEDGHYASIFFQTSVEDLECRNIAFKTRVPIGNPKRIRYSLNEEVILGAGQIFLICSSKQKFLALKERLNSSVFDDPLSRLLLRRPDVSICNWY